MTTKAEQLVVCEKAGECVSWRLRKTQSHGRKCRHHKAHSGKGCRRRFCIRSGEYTKCIPVGQEEITDGCEHKYIVMGLNISHRKIYECTKCGKREDG